MTKSELIYQANNLQDFIRRGGSLLMWFKSKDFSTVECMEIMKYSNTKAKNIEKVKLRKS